jgi:Haem-binding domain
MLKKTLIVLGILFALLQFIRPPRNLTNDMTFDITTKYNMPVEVSDILKGACYDCHSNKTEYPWYSYIQPVALWLNNHIKGGKGHLNYSNFARLPVANQNRKFEQTIEQVDKKEMPLESYTYLGLHKKANLSDNQRKIIIDWARAQMDTLKATYPADSLVVKRRQRVKQKN